MRPTPAAVFDAATPPLLAAAMDEAAKLMAPKNSTLNLYADLEFFLFSLVHSLLLPSPVSLLPLLSSPSLGHPAPG
jgi:hypothetical protein